MKNSKSSWWRVDFTWRQEEPRVFEFEGSLEALPAAAASWLASKGHLAAYNTVEEVSGTLYAAVAKDGKMTWSRWSAPLSVRLHCTRLDAKRFGELQDECLAALPEEFRSMVASTCYERGHAYGYDEVLGHVRELTHELLPVIQKYKERLLADVKKAYAQ